MAHKKPGRGVDQKGRSKRGGRFVRLGDGLLTSEAWRSLSGSAIKYYVELRRQFWTAFGLFVAGAGVAALATFALLGPWLPAAQDWIGRAALDLTAHDGVLLCARHGGPSCFPRRSSRGAAFPAECRLTEASTG